MTEVYTLTEPQYAEAGEGPWRIYIYRPDGYHGGGRWFRLGPMKYPDEEITADQAWRDAVSAAAEGWEVRVCDAGDMLVFNSVGGEVEYGAEFWKEIGLE